MNTAVRLAVYGAAVALLTLAGYAAGSSTGAPTEHLRPPAERSPALDRTADVSPGPPPPPLPTAGVTPDHGGHPHGGEQPQGGPR